MVLVAQHDPQRLHGAVAAPQHAAELVQQALERKQQGLAGVDLGRQFQPGGEALWRPVGGARVRPHAQQPVQVVRQVGAEAPGQRAARQAQQVAQLAEAHPLHRPDAGAVQVQAPQRQGAQLPADLGLRAEVAVLVRGQPGGLRGRRRAGQDVVTELPQFSLQPPGQLLRAAEQAAAGAGLQQQAVAVAGDADLAAVLVAPGGQALQRALRGGLVARDDPQFPVDGVRGRHRHAAAYAGGRGGRVAVNDPFAAVDRRAHRHRQVPRLRAAGVQVQREVRQAHGQPAGLGRGGRQVAHGRQYQGRRSHNPRTVSRPGRADGCPGT